MSVHYQIHRGRDPKSGDLIDPISREAWENAVRTVSRVRLRGSASSSRSEAEVCVGRKRAWYTGFMWFEGLVLIDMEVFMQGNGLRVPLKIASALRANVYDTEDNIQRSSKAIRLWLGGKLARLIARLLTGAAP